MFMVDAKDLAKEKLIMERRRLRVTRMGACLKFDKVAVGEALRVFKTLVDPFPEVCQYVDPFGRTRHYGGRSE